MSAPPDQRWIPAFLEAQAAEAGAARNTLLGYGRDLNYFLDYLQAKSLALETLSQAEIEQYLRQRFHEILVIYSQQLHRRCSRVCQRA